MAPKGPGSNPGSFPGGAGPRANPINIAWPAKGPGLWVQRQGPKAVDALVSQIAIEVLGHSTILNARISQVSVEVLTRVGVVVVGGGTGNAHQGNHKATVKVNHIGGLATAFMPAPAVSGTSNATVAAVPCVATANQSGFDHVIEGAPASVATANASAPAVSGGTSGDATVAAVAASASAVMPPPAVSGSPQPIQIVSGGGVRQKPAPRKGPRRRDQIVYAEAASAIAYGGRHLPVPHDPDFDLKLEEFVAELLVLDLIA